MPRVWSLLPSGHQAFHHRELAPAFPNNKLCPDVCIIFKPQCPAIVMANRQNLKSQRDSFLISWGDDRNIAMQYLCYMKVTPYFSREWNVHGKMCTVTRKMFAANVHGKMFTANIGISIKHNYLYTNHNTLNLGNLGEAWHAPDPQHPKILGFICLRS